MASTVAVPSTFRDESVVQGRRFYVRIAAACVAIAIVGFAPTYWLPMARGSLHVPPIVHIHGAFFFGWTIFFLVQAQLVGSGNVRRHRELGVAGVSLATAMCLIGVAVAINSIKRGDAAGFGPGTRAFSIVAFSAIVVFALLVGIALVNVRNQEIHKRLMLVATVSLLPAAIGRWFALFLTPPGTPAGTPPPVFVTVVPSLLSDLLIVAGMIYDRRTRGRVHPVYWITGAGLVAVQILRLPLSTTAGWMRITDWLVALSP